MHRVAVYFRNSQRLIHRPGRPPIVVAKTARRFSLAHGSVRTGPRPGSPQRRNNPPFRSPRGDAKAAQPRALRAADPEAKLDKQWQLRVQRTLSKVRASRKTPREGEIRAVRALLGSNLPGKLILDALAEIYIAAHDVNGLLLVAVELTQFGPVPLELVQKIFKLMIHSPWVPASSVLQFCRRIGEPQTELCTRELVAVLAAKDAIDDMLDLLTPSLFTCIPGAAGWLYRHVLTALARSPDSLHHNTTFNLYLREYLDCLRRERQPSPAAPPEFVFRHVMWAFADRGDVASLQALLKQVLEAKLLEPSARMFAAVIRAAVRSGDDGLAVQAYEELKRQNPPLPPAPEVYTVLLERAVVLLNRAQIQAEEARDGATAAPLTLEQQASLGELASLPSLRVGTALGGGSSVAAPAKPQPAPGARVSAAGSVLCPPLGTAPQPQPAEATTLSPPEAVKLLLGLWEELLTELKQPSPEQFDWLIRGLALASLPTEAFDAYSRLKEAHVEAGKDVSVFQKWLLPDTYSGLIMALANNPAELATVVKDMLTDGVRLTVSVYNALLDVYSRAPDVYQRTPDQAMRSMAMYEKMMRAGVTPNTDTFRYLLQATAWTTHVNQVKRIQQEMELHMVVATPAEYTLMIETCCRAGDFALATQLLRKMLDAGLLPQLRACKLLVLYLTKHGLAASSAAATLPSAVNHLDVQLTPQQTAAFVENMLEPLEKALKLPSRPTRAGPRPPNSAGSVQ